MCYLQLIYDKLMEVCKAVMYSMYYIRKVEVRFAMYISLSSLKWF